MIHKPRPHRSPDDSNRTGLSFLRTCSTEEMSPPAATRRRCTIEKVTATDRVLSFRLATKILRRIVSTWTSSYPFTQRTVKRRETVNKEGGHSTYERCSCRRGARRYGRGARRSSHTSRTTGCPGSSWEGTCVAGGTCSGRTRHSTVCRPDRVDPRPSKEERP